MNKFYWKHITDSTDATVLKNDLLDDMQSDLLRAIRNGRTAEAERIKREISQVKNWDTITDAAK